MAGAPDQREVRTLLEALGRHAGVLEVGLPYSDPWLDGPVVAEAGAEALRAGFRTADLFPLVEMLRVRTPAAITVMSYWNPVRAFGPPDFARRLAEAGGSAVLLPDLPVEEAEPWLDAAHQYGIRTSFLVSPDCSPDGSPLSPRPPTASSTSRQPAPSPGTGADSTSPSVRPCGGCARPAASPSPPASASPAHSKRSLWHEPSTAWSWDRRSCA